MASLSAAISFCPQALARPKRHSRNPNPNPNPNHRPKLKSRSSGHKFRPPPDAATTYTRLPPRDDFFSSSLDPSLRVSEEVNLSDAIAALDPPPAAITGEPDHHRRRTVVDSSTSSEDEVADYTEVEGYEISRDVFEGNAELNGDAEEEEEEEEYGAKQKEKRVPAVMRCFDRTKIFVKAGDGGNGVVAFRREKFVPFGGPSGGNGGTGGNVLAEVDGTMNSLLPFRKGIHFRAGKGGNGHGRMQNGAKGEDVVVKVAPGTVIRATQEDGTVGEVVLELLHPGQRALLLPGGRGGKGNASFKTGTNKVPRIAENGEEGPEMWLELELKLVADVGIVGAPNAGKSTLLSVVSAAQPTIANYPFTTLLPNLGVVSFDYNSTMVVADLPGLLEGAHWGFGLGHEFLRHTERCSVLVHVVDGSTLHPEYEFDAVRLELELFNPELAEKPCVIAFNKMDLPEACEKWLSFKEMLQARGIVPLCMSALKREGSYEVISAAYELLKKKKKTAKDYKGWTDPLDLNHIADMVNEQRKISMSEFEIFHETSSNTWQVTGYGLERFVQMTNWNYEDSMKRFERALEACGVNKTLIKRGVKEGDTVIVGEIEMVWHDDPRDSSDRSKEKKQYANSIRWPEWSR